MKHLIWIIAIIFLLIVQAGIFLPFHIELTNLMLLIVIISLLFAEFNFAIFLCLISGLCLDIVSGSSGVALISLTTVFLVMHFIINDVVDREPTLLILFSSVMGATISYFLVFYIVNWLFGFFSHTFVLNPKYFFLEDMPKSLILNLVFTYPIFEFYQAIEFINNKVKKHDSGSIRP